MRIGIDIGGTFLKSGLVRDDGTIVGTKKIRLPEGLSEEMFAKTLAQLASDLMRENNVSAQEVERVGMGVPGTADNEKGLILYANNLNMRNVPLRELFQRHLPLPVSLGNDANCAALGEYCAGAGKGSRSFVIVTIGTGIGGGIVLDGKMLEGLGGAAGEIGHMSIAPDGELCNCGRRGCWERYASASALCRQTQEKMKAHPKSAMWEICGGSLDEVDGRTAFLAAAQGDTAGKEVCAAYIAYLAMGITNLINILQPEILAIGGGISHEKDEALLYPLREIVERENYMANFPSLQTKIVKAQLGNDAGLIGAAMLG